MAGGGFLGRLFYNIDADNNTAGGLRAAEADARATAARIDAMKATVEIDFDAKELDKALLRARQWKKDLDADIKDLSASFDTLNEDQKGYLRALQNSSKRAGANIDRLTAKQMGLNAEMKQQQRIIRDVDTAEKVYLKTMKQSTKATQSRALEVAKLREEYAKLHTEGKRIKKMDWGMSARERESLRRNNAEMAIASQRLRAYGEDVDHLDAQLNRSDGLIQRWGRSFANSRIHLGFFSTSVRGAAVLLGTLGPYIFGAIGALSSLIGVLGTGLAGAMAVSAAGISGLGLAFFGIKSAIQPMTAELGSAWDAMTKYEEAVVESGKGSEEAAKAMEALETTLGAMPKSARQAFTEFAKMRSGFKSATGKALREPFFDTVAQGLKSASALMPIFQRETIATGKVVAKETQGWFKALRSPEGKDILSDVMSNFRKSIPGLMGGLGNIGAMFGRISQSASRFLPSLSGGFEDWTQNMMDSLGTGDKLDQKIGRIVDHMRQVGHTAQAGGRALMSFFGAGADEGKSLMVSMERTFNGWNKWMKSVEGSRSLRNFFAQSGDTMRQLLPALGNLLQTFLNISTAVAPAVEGITAFVKVATGAIAAIPPGFMRIAGAVGAAMYAFNRLKGIGSLMAPLAGLFGARGALGAAGKGGGAFATMGVGATAAGAGMSRAAVMGSQFLRVLGPLGLAVGAVGLALSRTTPYVSDMAKNTGRIPGLATKAAQATNQLKDSQKGLAAATRNVSQLQRQGKTDTKQYSSAVEDLAAADNQNARSKRRAATITEDYQSTMNSLKTDLREASAAQEEGADATARWSGATRGGSAAQAGWNKVAAANRDAEITAAREAMTLATVNYRREMSRMGPLTERSTKAITAMQRAVGKKSAVKIGLTGSDQVIQATSRISQRLKGLGQGQRAIKIIANSKDAEQAFMRLRKLMDQVNNKKVEAKAEGKDNASPLFNRIKSFVIPKKDVPIIGQDGSFWGTIASVAAAVIAPIVVPIIGQKQGFWGGAWFAGGQLPSYAKGGEPTQKQLNTAAHRAHHRQSKPVGPGAMVRSPTFLTGEINGDKEWVITDNQNWRQSNTGHLEDAAEALGYSIIPSYAKGGGKSKSEKKANKRAGKVRAGYDERMGTVKKKTGPLGGWLSQVKAAESDVGFWAEEYDLDRRAFDGGLSLGGVHGGFAMPDLLFDLQSQINAYGAIREAMRKAGGFDKLPTPTVPSGGKGKGYNKNRKAASGAKAKVEAYNNTVEELKGLTGGYTERGLDQLIRSLQLEMEEVQNQGAASQAAQAFGADQGRADLFSGFSSNIMSGWSGGGVLGISNSGSIASVAAGGGLLGSVPAGSVAGAGVASTPYTGGSTPGGGGVASVAGGTEISVTNNYAAPPEDPHTWSQSLGFELAAAI